MHRFVHKNAHNCYNLALALDLDTVFPGVQIQTIKPLTQESEHMSPTHPSTLQANQCLKTFLTNTFHRYRPGSRCYLWDVFLNCKSWQVKSYLVYLVVCLARHYFNFTLLHCDILQHCLFLHHQIKTTPRCLKMEWTEKVLQFVFPFFICKSLGLVGLNVFSASLTLMDCFPWTQTKR